MTTSELTRADLVILVPDSNMEHAFRGLLSRHQALQIRNITFDIRKHMHCDPGVLNEAHEFLRPLIRFYAHCLVVFDREGCGRENLPVEDLQREVEDRLKISGWHDRARVVVIDPELENWVWSNSPWVERCLSWKGREHSLREWLMQKNYWEEGHGKPHDPKGALESVLREVRKPRSSAIYLELARKAGFQRCTDPAFLRLKGILHAWFSC